MIDEDPADGPLRLMIECDVPDVLEVQEPGAVAALGAIFPQDQYPFPRETHVIRWIEEIHDPEIDCYVIQAHDRVDGFVACKDSQLLHFGTAIAAWGTGLATRAHDQIVSIMAASGARTAWLRVFEANPRARRFYEKHGWRATDESINSGFPPYPLLQTYELDLTGH